jgi:S-DNA-T family DNA segregation ATPase FtsK/SpoIIIE
MASASESAVPSYGPIRTWFNGCVCGVLGYVLLAACAACALTLASWTATDPAILHSSPYPVQNMLGPIGAIVADIIIHLFGLTGVLLILPPLFWGLQLVTVHRLDSPRVRIVLTPIAIALLACAAS